MADEKLNTGPGEEKLPETPAPVTADEPQAPAPKQAAAKRERVAAAEASGITEPVKPVCYPAGRWNGKVYGTAAYGYRIYVDNAEVQISGDDADALKKYADALEVWRKAVKAKE